MFVKVIGSHLCPDTMYALTKLKEHNVDVEFLDISTSFPALKAFLHHRETNPVYDPIRSNGGIGIPLFELSSGEVTLSLESVLRQ